MATENMIFSIEFGKHSAVGVEKRQDENAVGYYLPSEPKVLNERGQLFMVADGVGEANDGDVVSNLAIETMIRNYYESHWSGSHEQMLEQSLKKTNQTIREANINKGNETYYFCSLCCALIYENTLFVAIVGDCPAFLLSSRGLQYLTSTSTRQDEQPGTQLVVPAEPAAQRLGFHDSVTVHIIQRQIQIKDVIFLSTSNILEALTEDEIADLISTSEPMQACENLVSQTVQYDPSEDAAAIVIRIKGIKRVPAEESDISPQPAAPDREQEPQERQIVIKGVRYREAWEKEGLSDRDRESVDKFELDRELYRRVHKRATQQEKPKLPLSKILATALAIIIVLAAIYAIYTYSARFITQLKQQRPAQTITADSISRAAQADSLMISTEKDTLMGEPTPPVVQSVESVPITTEPSEAQVEPDQAITSDTPTPTFRVVIVDGSGKNIQLKPFIDDISKNASTGSITRLKSIYRIQQSKILWRKSDDVHKLDIITAVLLQHQNLFSKQFNTKVATYPLDFTLVLGADFKMPALRDQYGDISDSSNDYYIEILNGTRTSGLARKLSNLLHNQKFDEKRLQVVDYRNADQQNYPNSFIKCEADKNEIAANLARSFNLPSTIVNRQLFDIKIIIGTDVKVK
ncbi:MAG TPA: hypothetical protein ENN22_03480 [bacterium]|nr:hypothetical protein [bacterium]